MTLERYRLCYVEPARHPGDLISHLAYFTALPLLKQDGAGWNDSPYERKASRPHEDAPGRILVLRAVCALLTPATAADGLSGYSVEMINRGAAAWLFRASPRTAIQAGCRIVPFARRIRHAGGKVELGGDPGGALSAHQRAALERLFA